MNRTLILAATILAATSTSALPTPSPPPQFPAIPLCHIPDPAGTVPESLAGWAQGAQLFAGLGTRTRPVTTRSAEAQAYFDQGLRWLWAFNHDEATRSFARAAILDPSCAMCFWGVALTIGPNYNYPILNEARGRVAYSAMQKALSLTPKASPVEQALIHALTARYPTTGALTSDHIHKAEIAYANEMRKVASAFPADDDVQVLTGEAIMTINAWKLWSLDGHPADGTMEVLQRLQTVMARDPSHPGANHYYVHAVEASPHPEMAVAAAERLRGMMPGAGHLDHMPAHIFQRVGRYHDAAEANRLGALADLAYYKRTSPLDYYSGYTAHNFQFLAMSAAMEGNSAETNDAAEHSRASESDIILLNHHGDDWVMGDLYMARVRFGDWKALIATPAPDPRLTNLTAAWAYARGMALASTGDRKGAQKMLQRIELLEKSAKPDAQTSANKTQSIFSLASLILQSRIAGKSGDGHSEIALLQKAVIIEDGLAYNEPADWFIPARHYLGAAQLAANQPAAAELTYRQDLARNPENGWSLFGLTQALKAQHKTAEAQAIQARFDTAWQYADTNLKSSVF